MLSKSIPLKYFISRRSVVNPAKFLGESSLSSVSYENKVSSLESPLIPLMAFGMHFEIDVVIALKNDNDWGMIELFPVTIPSGERLWFSLDSKLDGSQFIGVPKNYHEHKDKFHFLFPGKMYDANLEVEENGNHYKIKYTRIDGVEVKTEVVIPNNAMKSMTPNGNTMNHSIQNSSIVLYLEKMGFISKGFKFNFDPNKVDRILGKRILMQLVQTAVGFMQADWEQTNDSLVCNGITVPLSWDAAGSILTVGSFPEVKYHFTKINEQLELREINIIQNDDNVGHIQLNPSLPDFRYKFTGEYNSKITISIKDLKGLLKGEVKGEGSDGTIFYRPISPHWAKNRPIDTKLISETDKIKLKSVRI